VQCLTSRSLSEFGCNTNKREFNEVASLYSKNMTPVYSGGLVYEYSMEESKYGLVTINGNSVTELDDFKTLKDKYSKTPIPSDDGGYKSSGSPSTCPTKSSTWNVTLAADKLPAFPSGADDLLKNGAGTGPGLKGDGSQNSGPSSTNLAGAADGAVTSGGSTAGASASKGAASSFRPGEPALAPFVCGAVVLISSLFGGVLML
jgi:1,3-beta-glucanosyltransferase GAS5